MYNDTSCYCCATFNAFKATRQLVIPILLILIILSGVNSQSLFIYEHNEPGEDNIKDVVIHDGVYHLFSNNGNLANRLDMKTTHIRLTSDGEFIDSDVMGDIGEYILQLQLLNDSKYLMVSAVNGDNCETKLIISDFNILTSQRNILWTENLCDHAYIENATIAPGLNGDWIIETNFSKYSEHGSNVPWKKHAWLWKSNNSLVSAFYDISNKYSLSIDFSGKGYLLGDVNYYEFYTSDLNFRKARYNYFGMSNSHKIQMPYRNGTILEYWADFSLEDDEFKGISLRVIDSTHLDEQRKTTIAQIPNAHWRGSRIALNEGILKNDLNEYWITGTYNYAESPHIDYEQPFIVAKLDEDLNVLCHHFIFNQKVNLIEGIHLADNGGVVLFGQTRVMTEPNHSGERSFMYVVGDNCELPMSTGLEDDILVSSISAFPNPTVNELAFSVEGFDLSSLSVQFIDIQGRVLASYRDLTNSVRVADFAPGQYMYRIMDNDKVLGVGSWVKK